MKAILLLYIGLLFVLFTFFRETLTQDVRSKSKVKGKNKKKIDGKQRVASKFRRIGQRIDVLEVNQNAEIQYRKEDTVLIFEKISGIEQILNTSLLTSEQCENKVLDQSTNDLSNNDNIVSIDEYSRLMTEFEDERRVNAKIRGKIRKMENNIEKQQEVLNTVLIKLNLVSKEENESVSKELNENVSKELNESRVGKTEDKEQNPETDYAVSCKDLYQQGYLSSGIYIIKPSMSEKPFKVYCDQTVDGGGWTLFQRRLDGSVDFNKTWEEYKNGFGDMSGEFWLGNKYLNLLTGSGTHELHIVLEDWENQRKYASYNRFNVLSEEEQYKLIVNGYNGDAKDSLTWHNGQMFSTHDRDNDSHSTYHCARRYSGGWWFRACTSTNLNGKYIKGGSNTDPSRGIHWINWRGYSYSYKLTEMKFR